MVRSLLPFMITELLGVDADGFAKNACMFVARSAGWGGRLCLHDVRMAGTTVSLKFTRQANHSGEEIDGGEGLELHVE